MRPLLEPCDPDLLARLAEDRLAAAEAAELERHLDGCADCREGLDRILQGDPWLGDARQHLTPGPEDADDPDETGPGGTAFEPLDFLSPSDWPDSLGRMGTYEIKGVLGRGGMGVVLKALDPALHRFVAVKVLSAHLATCGAARRRFLREARAAAAVVHEHVVAVHAVVETAGLPFLVMEYVPGRSLQDRLDRHGPLSPVEVLRIGMQTAAGLAAAHAQGLVHRDVKPANILLEEGVERVRLTDFGLARAAADAALTRSGVVAGTPHYMSPEQARGEPADHRADLFALGATLYTACAGTPPFRAETPLAVLRRVCDDRARPLREINPEVPAWLEAIVDRLMAKEPNDRFDSAAEVAGLLGRCLAHAQQPLAAPLPSELADVGRAKKPPRRRLRWLLGAGAVAVLCTAAVLVPGFMREDDEVRAPAATTLVDTLSADEAQVLFGDARGRAAALEAELRGGGRDFRPDPISEWAGQLARRAESLSRSLGAPLGGAPTDSDSDSQPKSR